MKKVALLFTIILTCFTSTLFARKIEGQIISSADTQNVVFNIPFRFLSKVPNFERLQIRVRYYDASGKLVTLKPDDAEEIRFMLGREQIRMLSRPNTLGANIFSNQKNIFLRLKIDGPLKMFHYYYTQTSPGMYSGATGGMSAGYSYSVENRILQKNNGELKRPRGLSFRKDMREYFSDCPQLIERIEAKDFRRSDMEAIVRFYNLNCAR